MPNIKKGLAMHPLVSTCFQHVIGMAHQNSAKIDFVASRVTQCQELYPTAHLIIFHKVLNQLKNNGYDMSYVSVTDPRPAPGR
jgi:hypothetical protein